MLPIHLRPAPEPQDARPPAFAPLSPDTPGPAGLPTHPVCDGPDPSAFPFPLSPPQPPGASPPPGTNGGGAALSRPGMPPTLRLGAGRPPSRAARPLPCSSASATRGDRPAQLPARRRSPVRGERRPARVQSRSRPHTPTHSPARSSLPPSAPTRHGPRREHESAGLRGLSAYGGTGRAGRTSLASAAHARPICACAASHAGSEGAPHARSAG